MPGNLLNADISFPDLTGEQSTQEKFRLVENYLYMLLEQLRYSFGNIGMENFNDSELDSLVNLITEPIYVQLEDEAGNIASIAATAEQLVSRMTDAEGNISVLQQTSTTIMSQVSDLEGNVSTLQQTSQSLAAQVSNVEGNVSKISVTVSGITQSVSDLETGMSQTLRISPNGVTITNAQGDAVTFDGGQIDATSLYVNAANIRGTLQIGQLPSSVATTGDIPQYTSELINNSGYQTESGVTTIVRGTVTTDYVNALGVSARYLQGQSVYLLNSYGGTVGAMTMTGASSSSYAVDLTSYGALRLTANYGAAYLQGSGGAAVGCSNEVSINGGNLRPANSGLSCGTASYPWSAVYANTSTIQTSDEKQKNSIEPLPEKYLNMMDHIEPKRYKLNDGESGRYHPGFVAQDVKAAMDAASIADTEFGGWCLDHDVDGNEIQMLRMEEFIPIMWAKIRQQETRIKKLEENGNG